MGNGLLRAVIDDWIFVSKNFFDASAWAILSYIMTNIAFVPFCSVLLHPCAMPPKTLPNAVCYTSAVAGSCIIFFVAGDCATSDWMNHCICVVFKIEWHFCMFHECTWSKDCAQCGLFVDGKYVYGLLGHNTLPCTTGKGCVHCLCPASWLLVCELFKIGRNNFRNLLNKVWCQHNPQCVVSSDSSMEHRCNFQHAFGCGVV
jgi:hypothetical protein